VSRDADVRAARVDKDGKTVMRCLCGAEWRTCGRWPKGKCPGCHGWYWFDEAVRKGREGKNGKK
jgi:hypothetical protein